MFLHLCVILFTGEPLSGGGLCQGNPSPTVTCGRNASYWNAFLFSLLNVKCKDVSKTSKPHRNGRFTQAVATMNTIAGRRVYSNHKHMGYYRPQQWLQKGNVFTSVCQEFCPGGVSQHALGGGCTRPRADIPPPRRPLQRTVRILLEYILVFTILLLTLQFQTLQHENKSVSFFDLFCHSI